MFDKSTDGVLVDGSSLKGGTSDESDRESIFEEGWSKRSNLGTRNNTLSTSIYNSDTDKGKRAEPLGRMAKNPY
jgi:hypothetical protein